MQYITALDYVLLPFVLGMVYFIAFRIRNKMYPTDHPWRKYFILALTVKIFGAIANGMIHYYYYGGGDTYRFFHDSLVINTALNESVVKWINLLFGIPGYYEIDYYRYTSELIFYTDPPSYPVASIAAFFNLFTFGTYLPTAVFFAFISFSGIWALFRTFAKLYPHLTHQIAIVTLFIPTTVFWGSAVYKDTICIFGLGWLTYGSFRFLVERDFSVKNILLAVMSFILVSKVKVYILIAFMPALVLWILFNYTQSVKQKAIRSFVKVIVPILIIALSLLFMSTYSKEMGSYSLDNLASSSESMRTTVQYISLQEEGSGYTLGEFDPSLQGMLSKFPQAVNVSLFRPYLWESKKVIVLFSAIESLLFLILTLRVLFLTGLRKTWQAISSIPSVQFSLVFTLIFAFAVGITTYNFGSLSRYKIPCLPFYALAMVLIFYRYKPAQKKILPPFF